MAASRKTVVGMGDDSEHKFGGNDNGEKRLDL